MKNFYCTICLEETPHNVTIDGNGEFLTTCTVCKHFIKFPATFKAKDFDGAAKEHKAENEGKISLAEQEKVLEELKANTMADKDAEV